MKKYILILLAGLAICTPATAQTSKMIYIEIPIDSRVFSDDEAALLMRQAYDYKGYRYVAPTAYSLSGRSVYGSTVRYWSITVTVEMKDYDAALPEVRQVVDAAKAKVLVRKVLFGR